MTAEPKRVKSNEARRDWAEILQHVRQGGTVIVEHYNKPIATITPYKEPTVDTTYTASIGLVSSVVADDHCDVAVHENKVVGIREDDSGNEVPVTEPSGPQVLDTFELPVSADDEDVAAKAFDAADEALYDAGWRRTGDWDDAAGDAAYAPVERA